MTNVYVEEARLINCQSFDDGVYSFSKGLNVFKASGQSNQTGKSVYFKMIAATVSSSSYSRNEWRDLIAESREKAMFALQFSDRTISLLVITRQGPTYFFHPDIDDPTKTYIKSNSPFKEVREKLGVVVDAAGNILNVVNQGSISKFTENTSTSPDIINQVVTHDELEALIQNLDLSAKRIQENIYALDAEIFRHKYIIDNNKFVDVDAVESILKAVESSINVMGVVLEIERVLENLSDSFDTYVDFSTMIKACTLYEYVLGLEIMVKNYDELESDYGNLELLIPVVNLIDKLEDISLISEDESEVISSLSSVLKLSSSLLNIELIEDEWLVDNLKASESLDGVWETLSASTSFVENLESIEKFSEEIADLRYGISLLGKEVECPIYGRIQHDNGICIPLSDRYSLSS